MSTYRPERKAYFREYMRKRRAAQPKAPRVWKMNPASKARAARKGFLAKASAAAAQFCQPSLLKFPPRLQAEFEAIMAQVKCERGMQWSSISLVHQ